MKDNEKCFVCNKDITNQLPKIDIDGNHYCNECYLAKCKKEKQIEEMAQYLKGYLYPLDNNSIENCRIIASALISQGWIKLPEDSVVLSREEFDVLKFNAEHYDPFWFCSSGGCEGVCKECKDTCEMSIFVKERKETTEKILNEILDFIHNETFHKGYELKKVERKTKELAKQFGVELKE